MIKQFNIFGDIDMIDPEGNINRCEVCGRSMSNVADCCSEECAKKSIENIFGNYEQNTKQTNSPD